MIRVAVMVGKGPDMPRYQEYLRYIERGELDGTLSYDEWVAYSDSRESHSRQK